MDGAVPRDTLPGVAVADAAVRAPQHFSPPLAPAAPPATNRVESFAGGPWALPWSPTACATARAAVREVLPQWHLSDLVPTAELLVSELVSNALRHASGPLRLTLERVSSVRCLVSDGSCEPPRRTDAGCEDEHGRGLALVDALAARWGFEYGPVGKTVWCELPTGSAPEGDESAREADREYGTE
ncbi:ATP-binding protein [Streptomyces sp. NPDC002553]|uniref:ATP-binding protein n=1 Tax=Streptomyces sp. NPDC002553 TaxID=3154417 RepID=UPI003332D668